MCVCVCVCVCVGGGVESIKQQAVVTEEVHISFSE